MHKKLFIADRIAEISDLFEELGAEFVTPASEIAQKLKKIKIFVFDWDGVFNDGRKGADKTSDFAEPDTMGTHIIRYAYWKLTGQMPLIAVITGQDNHSAYHLAEREHFAAVFAGYKNKFEPIELLKKEFNIKEEEIASTFDDIIDYPLAVSSGLRFFIRRSASPLLMNHFKENHLCDYITAHEQPHFPVREISEMVVGLLGNYDEMLVSRFKEKDKYKVFWDERQSVETKIFKNENKKGL